MFILKRPPFNSLSLSVFYMVKFPSFHVKYLFKSKLTDAGKSTIGGQILFLSDQVDERTIQKYEKEAKDKSRESW